MRRALVGGVLALIGCGRGQGPRADGWQVPLSAPGPADPDADPVVATVDGRPIRASDVALQARAKGEPAKAALAELIDGELLAGEAARRGLDRDRDALEAARAEGVRQLVARTFEKEVTPESIPMNGVRHFYDDNQSSLNHDEKVDVWHIIVPTATAFTDADKQAARAAAEELARRARGIGSADAFVALAPTVTAPIAARAEHVQTALHGWTVREFATAAFALEKPGDVSPVVETKYGFHVIYLIGRIAPLHLSLADAEPKIRATLFPDYQRREFLHYADRVAGSHALDLHPERLRERADARDR
jgi:peptidyl-prolyl cis-trans isomerase C